jgi:hypothetical protein
MSDRKPRRVITAQPKFTMLVANLKAGSDPSKGTAGNPVKARSTYTQQYLPEVPGRGHVWGAGTVDPHRPGTGNRHAVLLSADVGTGSTFTITVADNDFTSPATLYLGNFTITSGEELIVAGSTALTAANLADAINALPGFSAPAPAGSTVTVTGPSGPNGNVLRFEAVYEGAIANFTISPSDGSGDGAEPHIGPPEIA